MGKDGLKLQHTFNEILLSEREIFSREHMLKIYQMLLSLDEKDQDFSPLVLIHEKAVTKLNKLAVRMINGGLSNECCRIFKDSRKNVLLKCMGELSLYPSKGESLHRMPWNRTEEFCEQWLESVGPAIRVLLASERFLCDSVFLGLPQCREFCFAEITTSSIEALLSFVHSLAMSKRVPEKLFKVLDIYETLNSLLPYFNAIFTGETCRRFRKDFKMGIMRLSESARAIFSEFENAISNDTSTPITDGGNVHGLTRYVVNYLIFAYTYRSTLKEVFLLSGYKEKDGSDAEAKIIHMIDKAKNRASETSHGLSRVEETENEGNDEDSSEDYESSDNESDMENDGEDAENYDLLIDTIFFKFRALQKNLETKSKSFKEPALGFIFMMNNMYYIASKVKGSELRELLGDDWILECAYSVRDYATKYQKVTWSKLLAEIKPNLPAITNKKDLKIRRYMIKEKFKIFNAILEEILKSQNGWVIPDKVLREELRCAIKETVIHAYKLFYDQHSHELLKGKLSHKHIKYDILSLEEIMHGLYSGTQEK